MTPSPVTRVTLALSVCLALAFSLLGIAGAQARPAPSVQTAPAVQTTAAAPTVEPAQKAAPKYSRAQRKARAAQIMSTSFANWKKIKARSTHTGIDATFTWADDGCSAEIGDISAPYRKKFNSACERHDFGYRNLGNGYYSSKNLALSSFPDTKLNIDKILRADAKSTCIDRSCRFAADRYYDGVTKFGKAFTAFYKGECQPGYICFFDDTNYEDRRVALRGQVSDFNAIDFGDKTSSVANFSKSTWRIYDDNGFSDRSVCLAPRARSANLASSNDFNDKVSSARPRSSC